MMGVLLGADGRPFAKPKPRRLRASYDAASTSRHNERHWANSDNRDASAALSPDVRKKIRERARYEAQESNSYAKGMVLTLANDTIGTGPRLQLMIPGRADASRRIEREFMLWSYEARLAEKLRTMRVSKAVDGEAFAAFVTNPALSTRVQLDLALIECDRVKAPWWVFEETAENADGVQYDRYGNPQSYTVLREHPGTDFMQEFGKFDTVPARDMIHLFRVERPGQRRGVSELAASLQVFADLRRFSLATIRAAEWAASHSGILYTDEPDIDDDSVDALPGETVEVEHNSLLVVDNGRKLAQLKAEHPATTYEMFHREKLREAARSFNMPYNVASGDSSKYNYASGRLDHQTYDRSIKIEQDYFGSACLDPTFLRWLEEAMLIPGYLPEALPPFVDWNWLWFFDGRPHVDPLKEAAAAVTLRDACLQTEKAYFAERGLDWEEQERQLASEMGLTVQELRKLKALKRFAGTTGLSEAVLAIIDEEAAAELAEEEAVNADE